MTLPNGGPPLERAFARARENIERDSWWPGEDEGEAVELEPEDEDEVELEIELEDEDEDEQ